MLTLFACLAGICPTYKNLSVGTPVTYKFRSGVTGMWLKDPMPVSEEDKTKIFEVKSQAAVNQNLYSWTNLNTYEATDFYTK